MRRRILVVDDERRLADTLAQVLRLGGFETLSAHDGGTALKISAEFLPDLVITDVSMPVMDGIELATELGVSLPDCKVLLFSGQANAVEVVQCSAMEKRLPLLSKPVHPKDLMKVVESMIGPSQADDCENLS